MKRREAVRNLGLGVALPVVGDLLLVGSLPFEGLLRFGTEVRRRMVPGALAAFTEHEAVTVTALTELILPATETAGATDAGVTAFIDHIVAEWYTAEERTRFMDGLTALDQRAGELFGSVFVELGADAQKTLVGEMDQQVQAVRQAERERPAGTEAGTEADTSSQADDMFFHQLKRLTLTGYFTSEAGMTETLRYRIVPGAYEPCIPLDR